MIDVLDNLLISLRDDLDLTNLLGGANIYHLKLPTDNNIDTYIILTEISNTESGSADDEEYADDIELQADIWTTKNVTPIKKQLQKVMRSKGFTHQAMPDMWDKDIKKTHKPIRFFTTQYT